MENEEPWRSLRRIHLDDSAARAELAEARLYLYLLALLVGDPGLRATIEKTAIDFSNVLKAATDPQREQQE